MVIALGTGSYAGLSSVTEWRRTSTDDAYAQLRMFDLRVELADGTTVATSELESKARSMPSAGGIELASERLVTEIQVDASTADETIVVPGLLYGIDLLNGGPDVNRFYVPEGRVLTEADRGDDVALLEYNFTRYYELLPGNQVTISGGQTLMDVGHAMTPEYFFVTTERGGFLAEANFAAVFTSLETAQEMSDKPGRVNDLLITTKPGADVEAMREDLTRLFAEYGAEVITRAEDPAYRLNDSDIKGDQQIYEIFAVLIVGGAVGAAFNLSTRIVDAQRREIGIAMAMGLPPGRIAVRPMLVGAQVALLGVVLGLGVGYVIGNSLISLAKELMPLPEWKTDFQFDLFASVAIIGFLLPLIATAWPVWRAVRVPPIETIRPAYRSGRGGGLAPMLRWLHLPGNTMQQAPLRNIVRAPRRSLVTGLGIAAALAALVAFVGMIDSFITTIDRGDSEILGDSPDRIEVSLAGFFPVAGGLANQIEGSPLIGAAEPGLSFAGRMVGNGTEIDAQIDLLNLESEIWRPSLIDGSFDRSKPGIYISELASRDLAAAVGSTVELQHPRLQADGSVTIVSSHLTVLGVHPHPFRFATYMDINQASIFGTPGLMNRMSVVPAEGVSDSDVKRALISLPGVASMESVGDIAAAIRDLLDEFVVVLRVVEVAMLLIALLIAFNAASINIDERTREHATMFAFGVPVGTVMRMTMVENLILGIGATIAGVVGGWFLLRLIISTRVEDTMPDIYIKPYVSETTLLVTLFLGVVCVTFAPLLMWRKLSKMDVPGSLKVVE